MLSCLRIHFVWHNKKTKAVAVIKTEKKEEEIEASEREREINPLLVTSSMPSNLSKSNKTYNVAINKFIVVVVVVVWCSIFLSFVFVEYKN